MQIFCDMAVYRICVERNVMLSQARVRQLPSLDWWFLEDDVMTFWNVGNRTPDTALHPRQPKSLIRDWFAQSKRAGIILKLIPLGLPGASEHDAERISLYRVDGAERKVSGLQISNMISLQKWSKMCSVIGRCYMHTKFHRDTEWKTVIRC